MEANFKFKVKGPIFNPVIRGKITFSVFFSAMNEALLLIQSAVVRGTPRGATGNLKRSINTDIKGGRTRPMRGEVGTPLKYGIPIERGIRAGRGFPKISAIEHWIKRKLKPSSENLDSVTFLVARNIQKRGTKGHFMFEKAFEETAMRVERIFEAAGVKLVRTLE